MKTIRRFSSINELHAATGFPEWTHNPLFQVFSTAIQYENLTQFMPPYTQNFYQIGFSMDLAGTSFALQTTQVEGGQNLLYFVAPGQVLSWSLGNLTNGFVLFIMPELLGFYPHPLADAFPFFSATHTDTLTVPAGLVADLYDNLTALRRVYANPHVYQQEIIQGLLLALLFRCRAVYDTHTKTQSRLPRGQQLVSRFQQLINAYFIEHKNVSDYAALLNVTPNYLSALVTELTGKTAKVHIAERTVLEAKNLLRYTELDVSEIAYQLGFGEVTHFGRFFKNETGQTPGQFRVGP